MNYTDNYQLNQWEAADRVLMSNFNEDNAKIDAALLAAKEEATKALAEYKTSNDAAMNQKAGTEAITALEAKIALCGNCKIVTGSYTGTGTYGSGSPTKLTFDSTPLAVFISGDYDMFAVFGAANASVHDITGLDIYYGVTVNWSGNTVQWYHSSRVYAQLNTSGQIYHYVALLAA